MVLLQLCRWKFSHKETLYRVHLIEIDFYLQKRQIRFLSHPLGVRGNVRTLFIARWKASGQLSIRDV